MPKGWPLLLVLLLLSLSTPSLLRAQSSEDHPWTLASGVGHYFVTDVNGWSTGVQLLLDRRFGNHIRPEFLPQVATESNGFYRFGGLIGELGIGYEIEVAPLRFIPSFGVIGILGSDSDGSLIAGAGPYLAGRIHLDITDRFGLFVRAGERLFQNGDFGLFGSGGLALRL